MRTNASRILKRGAVGRVRYSREQREAILDRFERSGLKGAAFARTTGLPYQTFAAWIQRRRHERGDYRMRRAPAGGALRRGGPEKAVRLVEVMLARPDPAAATVDAPALRVELPCGTRLLVADDRQAILAARVLQALASVVSC